MKKDLKEFAEELYSYDGYPDYDLIKRWASEFDTGDGAWSIELMPA